METKLNLLLPPCYMESTLQQNMVGSDQILYRVFFSYRVGNY